MPHAVDPVRLTLRDGREVDLFLSMAGVKRVKERLGYKTMAELLERDVVDCLPIFWEAVQEKDGLEEGAFAELLPADLPLMSDALLRLLHVSQREITGPPAPASPNP